MVTDQCHFDIGGRHCSFSSQYVHSHAQNTDIPGEASSHNTQPGKPASKRMHIKDTVKRV